MAAAGADPWARLQQEATCSICRELYTDPVTLDCGHNFCLSCFDTFKRKEDLEKACPECRQSFDPGKEMKPNKRLANMVEAVKELQIAPGSLCKEHGVRLQLLCETDGELLCVFCMGSEAHREHRVIPVKEAEQEHKDASEPWSVDCPQGEWRGELGPETGTGEPLEQDDRSTLNRCEKGKFQCPEQEMTKGKEKETNIEFVKTQKPEEEINKYKGTVQSSTMNNNINVVYGSCDGNGDLTILLIGSTGAGKSATGNSILGEKHFVSRASPTTVTVACEKRTCDWDGRQLVVVDTPGFLNSNRAEEVSHSLKLCGPGPSAIVLVLQTGRFTQEEREAVQRVQDLFGAQLLKRMVVVFTRRDDLGDKSIQTFVKEAEPTLKKLITKCENRYCAFNNRATGEENNKQVSELIKIIEKMNSTKLRSPKHNVPRKAMKKGMAIGVVLGLAILLGLLGVVVGLLARKH